MGDSVHKRHVINPKYGEATQFSETNQPTGVVKSIGWAKRRTGLELVKYALETNFKGKAGSELKKASAQYFGISEDDITVEMMLIFRQIEKAISESDTPAFKAVMERAFGMPKQQIESANIGIIKVVREGDRNKIEEATSLPTGDTQSGETL